MTEETSYFLVLVTGQLECAEIQGVNSGVYCKYSVVYGKDWDVLQGLEEGITQIALKPVGENDKFVFNFPIEISFKSTNIFGWPQISLSVFGDDAFGRDVVRGYGAVHIPTAPGRFVRDIRLFTPKSSSMVQSLTSWLVGTRPEYIDPKTVTRGQGREVTRVESNGKITLKLNVVTKDMETFRYVTHETPVAQDLRDAAS